ncbi:secretion system protein Por [Flavobacterium album]|uniref:Secretion system protein Por n=1 Tax=Flavobacterium album TaxID=2175091 RepID=A0A2S1QY26_9FLAO|nr:CotH kinase family protein [Flavobacterium album]AWH85303.1 secretion system protein Por [Flavobacterium album]
MKQQLRTVSFVHLRKFFIAAFLLIQAAAWSQVTFTDSNLPIVIITTDNDPDTGQPMEIPDDPKIPASMKIIFHPDGTRNYMTDQNTAGFLNYNGRIKIELRGSSSQLLEKKQYGWTTYENNDTTKKDVSLLGMPSERDWILNGLAFDSSLIRDYLCYNLTRQMGQYATRTQYCEVIINGDYRGLYILQEKIKDDSKRVNIEEIDENASEGMALTGGYITKADKTTGGDPIAWQMDSYQGWPTDFVHELPKPEDITPAQNDYIHSQFQLLESASGAGNASLANGYPSVIDIPTFVDFMIINEFSSNVDAYQISTFFHKDKGGKLRAGPAWDFNLSLGLDVFGDRSQPDIWQFSNGDNEGAKFWTDLFNNSTYRCYFSRRWHELTQDGKPLSFNHIETFIDETIATITEASVREQQRWGTVPNLGQEIHNIKDFILARMDWMDANIGSFTACSNVDVPELVISRINYNPSETTEFPESDDQEFIQITNAGTTEINLTGVYLSELGISYQFPVNATLAAGQSLYIASNPTVFEAKYGVAPFGQFQRNLSNNTQKLVLADGFGNVIDVVEYDDDTPWPNADGNGSYLQLVSLDLDNSLASSWVASVNDSLSTDKFNTAASTVIYPNPVGDMLYVKSGEIINSVMVYDIYGKLLQSKNLSSNTASLDFSQYAPGIYLVKASGSNGTATQKIIKQ